MVHELSSLVQSNIFTNRPSLLNIHQNHQESSNLRQYIIANLDLEYKIYLDIAKKTYLESLIL